MFGSTEKAYERAEKRYIEKPTDTNYKLMLAAKIRMERKQ